MRPYDSLIVPSASVRDVLRSTLLEAMACFLPIVCTSWDGYKDLDRDGENGFRVPVLWTSPDRREDALDSFARPYSHDVINLISEDLKVDEEAAVPAAREDES